MLATVLLTLFMATSQPAAIGCDHELIRSLACLETPRGLIVAAERTDAEPYVALAAEAEALFRARFGVAPSRYAMLVGPTMHELAPALRQLGLVTLPWITDAQRIASGEAQIRQSVEAMARERGMTATQTEAIVNSALANARSRASVLDDDAIVAHELGHQWFVARYWATGARASHYGGPAPDWLDEAAAISMEGDRLSDNRRRDFRAVRAGTNSALGAEDSLDAYLGRAHPMAAYTARLREEVAAGRMPRAGVLTGAAIQRLGVRPTGIRAFYAQTRVFVDFLTERSGDARIIASIAETVGAGGTFERWLASHGRSRNLGGTLTELAGIWGAWLERNYPASAAPTS